MVAAVRDVIISRQELDQLPLKIDKEMEFVAASGSSMRRRMSGRRILS